MDGRIAKQKWDSIVERTEPIIQAIEDATFTRADLYQLSDAIESQSELASELFKTQLKVLERQIQGLKPQVEQTLEKAGIPISEANITAVLDRAYQKMLARQFPKMVSQLQKALLADKEKKEKEKDKEKKEPSYILRFAKGLMRTALASYGMDFDHQDQMVFDPLAKVTEKTSKTVDKLASLIGSTISADKKAKLRESLDDMKKAMSIAFSSKYSAPFDSSDLPKQVKDEQAKTEQKVIDKVPLINSVKESQKVDLGQVNLGPANSVLPPSIQPEGINFDPIMNLIIDQGKEQGTSLDYIKEKSDWLVKTFKSYFNGEDKDDIESAESKRKRNLIGKLFDKTLALQNKTQKKVSKILEQIGFDSDFSKLIGMLALPALATMIVPFIKSVDWGAVMGVIGSSVWGWIKDQIFPTSDKKGNGVNAKGKPITTVQAEDGTYFTVERDEQGNITTSHSAHDPRLIQEGKHKGWIVEKKEDLADANGESLTLYNPQTMERKIVQRYDDSGQEIELPVRNGRVLQTPPKSKIVTSVDSTGKTLTAKPDKTPNIPSAVKPNNPLMPNAKQSTTSLNDKVTKSDLSMTVDKPQPKPKAKDNKGQSGSFLTSGAMNLNVVPQFGVRNDDAFALLNMAGL